MIDRCGRTIDYIRISVTDRCNLRCIYCMPEEGVENIDHGQILRFDEILRICGILAKVGVKKVKITGGEPLVRRGIENLIRDLKQIPGIENITITTNGVLLEEMYDKLIDAGIDAITISLDTLDPKTFEKITRRDESGRVFRGLTYALEQGKVPLKINCVPVLGVEEQHILSIVGMAKDYKVHVRFIEMMPIGLGQDFPFVEEDKLRHILDKNFGPLTPCFDVEGNGPCHYYSISGFSGKIGFISAVSHKFCSQCNRIRLTSEGFLKTCLQYDYGVELKPILQSGCSDKELEHAILEAVAEKPTGHNFGESSDKKGREHRGMSQIGG